MRITFIRPHLNQLQAADALEPLVFAYLARFTPPDVDLKLYDARIEPIPYDEPTDLVALTVDTFTARQAYQIAARYRRRGIPVIMGGYHPSLLPEEASRFSDSIVIGDAENLWIQIVTDARDRNLKPVYRAVHPPNLEGLQPDRTIFQNKPYPNLHMVQFGRGCRYHCDFCSIHVYYGNRLYNRKIEDVVQEIASLPSNGYIFLVDDNLFVNQELAREFLQAIAPLHARWACQISIDITQTPSLLDLLARSGCFGVFIGLESINEQNLAQMRKKWAVRNNDYPAAIRQFHEHNIMVFGSFVFGYDGDTPDIFDQTLEFAMRSRLALAHFNPLIPIPATSLYKRLQTENRLLFRCWWLDEDYRYGQMVFRPKHISPDEVTSSCFRLRRSFNAYPAMLKRFMVGPSFSRPFVYWAANLTSRREIYNKQGQPLGDGSPLPPV
ncbi:MAG: B12-binding domain-containing radical SAM protein [Anaerolineales bacterium]|nr:B12-binding domain-containing radical SAM protein [Anaerolineales bacterium]